MENTQNPKKPNMKWLRITGTVFIAVFIFAAGVGGGVYYQKQNSLAVRHANKADIALINQALETVQDNYVDQSAVNTQNLTYAAISGMVASLGDTDHTVFLTPAEVQQENQAIAGKYEELVGKLQERYGIANEKSKHQGNDFKKIVVQLKRSNARLMSLQARMKNSKPAPRKITSKTSAGNKPRSRQRV